MQVNSHNSVGTGSGQQVGNQTGTDWLSGFGLAVLTGIAEIWHDAGNFLTAGTLDSIQTDQYLHQILVDRSTGGLNDEDMLATNGFLWFNQNFTISEMGNRNASFPDAKNIYDFLGKLLA